MVGITKQRRTIDTLVGSLTRTKQNGKKAERTFFYKSWRIVRATWWRSVIVINWGIGSMSDLEKLVESMQSNLASLVEDWRFASFPKASFASDVGATPQVSTQMMQTRSALMKIQRNWAAICVEHWVVYDAHHTLWSAHPWFSLGFLASFASHP